MKISLNGQVKTVNGPMSLSALLDNLSIQPDSVVVELNSEIIPPDAYNKQSVQEADSVEIIRFVGGG